MGICDGNFCSVFVLKKICEPHIKTYHVMFSIELVIRRVCVSKTLSCLRLREQNWTSCAASAGA